MKKWRLHKPNPQLQVELGNALNVHPVVAQLLINRGISEPGLAERFISPKLSDMHDPFLFDGMEKAVARLKAAKDRHEKVMVYGDYDVDGVTGTAVLMLLLKKLGIECRSYIPHRMDEGYGLNFEIVPVAKAEGIKLLISVDCGICSAAEIEELARHGIETIVIDHHEPDGRVPDAIAVIDPKKPGCRYPFRDLAGVGLASKFAQAVLGEYPREDLDLVALGTIADVVPLLDENRIIARFGLPVLQSSTKRGLQALIDSSKIRGKEMTAHSVGFVLGPRLNAAGRMGSANTSLDLLLSEDPATACSLAQILESHNRSRQKMQSEIIEEALEMIDANPDFAKDSVIVVHKEGWHKGLVGIAASKIADRYGRPAIVIAMDNGLGSGSARSVEGFHLNEALAHCSGLLVEYGGHKRAAGLRVKDDCVDDFRSMINVFAKEKLEEKQLMPVIQVDAELPLPQVSMELINLIENLAPHGEGNPAPVFGTRRLMVKSRPQTLGKDTIKFWVTDGRTSISAVGFGMASDCASLRMGNAVDIVYTLGIDDWNKAAQPQIMLKDLRIQA